MRRQLKIFWRSIRREGMIFLLAFVGYLVQMCIMPYVKILGVTPSIIISVTSIVTVSFGRLRAFWIGSFYGIILECMQPSKTLFNLMIYPVAAILSGLMFSDKSVQQLEYERGVGKAGRNVSPLIRTPVCAMVNTAIYETVNVAYIYLRGADLNSGHIGRALLDILATTLLTVLLMVPVRRLFGFRITLEEDIAPKPY